MATEQASTVTTEYGSLPKWASWLAALVGLWVLVSPFVLSGAIGSGTPMWSNVIAGLVVLVLGAFGAYSIRTSAETAKNSSGEWSGWITALAGLWILVSPFVLSGMITAGTAKWSNVGGGVVALILAAYAGYYPLRRVNASTTVYSSDLIGCLQPLSVPIRAAPTKGAD